MINKKISRHWGAILFLSILSTICLQNYAQQNPSLSIQKSSLQKEQHLLEEKIKQTQQSLKSIGNDISATLIKLEALQHHISDINKLIAIHQEQLKNLSIEFVKKEKEASLLAKRKKNVANTYYSLLQKIYKFKKSESSTLYLLSSSSLNQASRRYVYFSQIEKKRKVQLQKIQKIALELEAKSRELEYKKKEQQKLLASQVEKKQELEKSKKEFDKVLSIAKNQKKEISNLLKIQEEEQKKLEKEIEKIIKAELKKAIMEKVAPNEEFSKNKGHISWPVENGEVIRRFGKQPHPTISSLTIVNNGVEIRADKNAIAKNVFDGEIIGILEVPGYQQMVILRHGTYYTVYSRIDQVLVKKGDKVKRGESIGYIHNGKTGTVLHFEIWKEKTKLNPESWLK